MTFPIATFKSFNYCVLPIKDTLSIQPHKLSQQDTYMCVCSELRKINASEIIAELPHSCIAIIFYAHIYFHIKLTSSNAYQVNCCCSLDTPSVPSGTSTVAEKVINCKALEVLK